jgi:hypothetical protein
VNILTVNLLLSTVIFWIAARLYVLPTLEALQPQTILLPILPNTTGSRRATSRVWLMLEAFGNIITHGTSDDHN